MQNRDSGVPIRSWN